MTALADFVGTELDHDAIPFYDSACMQLYGFSATDVFLN